MDSGTDPRRVQISLRLKAGRYLAGRAADESDRRNKVIPLPTKELAENSLLMENRITKNRLEEIEQLKTQARPYELEVIGRALGLPPGWFGPTGDEGQLGFAERLVQAATEAGRQHQRNPEAAAEGGGEPGRQG